MNTIQKMRSITPAKKKKFGRLMTFLAGLVTLTGVLFPAALPFTIPAGAYLGYLAAEAATETISIDDVKQMSEDEQKVLFNRLLNKGNRTDHDEALVDHILKDEDTPV